jgi:hypothetical protein
MVHVPECAAWTWDARPDPFFPALTDVWTDGGNWRLGHWLTGRLGAVSLAALVRHLCLRAGLPNARIDVTGPWGAVEGYAITAPESPRASNATLSRHFGFDVATLAPDDLVAAREGGPPPPSPPPPAGGAGDAGGEGGTASLKNSISAALISTANSARSSAYASLARSSRYSTMTSYIAATP